MTARTVGVSQVKVGKTQVQTGIGVGGTEVGGNGNARTVVVSEVEVGRTDRTEVQTELGMSRTGRKEWDRGCI